MKYGRIYLNNMKVDYFLLTKYNVGITTGKYAKRQEEWMRDRLELFKRFTLPSVLSQTHPPYKWVLFIDRATDPEQHRLLWDEIYKFNFINIGLTDSQSIIQDARKYVNLFRRNNYVVTTRLDNDDAIHKLFFEKIEEQVKNPPKYSQFHFIVNFDWGIVYNPKTWDIRISRQGSNPFISKIEKGSDIQTVWGFKHTEASRYGQMIRLGEESTPMWIQTVHGKNVSNRMQGSPYEEHKELFNNVDFQRYYEENFT